MAVPEDRLSSRPNVFGPSTADGHSGLAQTRFFLLFLLTASTNGDCRCRLASDSMGEGYLFPPALFFPRSSSHPLGTRKYFEAVSCAFALFLFLDFFFWSLFVVIFFSPFIREREAWKEGDNVGQLMRSRACQTFLTALVPISVPFVHDLPTHLFHLGPKSSLLHKARY